MKKNKKFFIKRVYPDPDNLEFRISRLEKTIDRYIIAKEIEKHSRPSMIFEEDRLSPIINGLPWVKYNKGKI